jgi:hypothetical protein
MIYLGCDPGQRTGIAFFVVDDDSVILINTKEIYGGVDGFVEWWETARTALTATPARIVYEGFVTREGKFGVDHEPERVIGALKALANRDGIPIVERAPAGRKRQMPDAALKRLGLYVSGEKNRNVREAVRHVASHLKTMKNPVVLDAFRA